VSHDFLCTYHADIQVSFEKGDEPPKLYLDDMDKLILGRVAQTPIRRPKKQAVVKNKRKAAEEATEEATESPAAKKIKLEDETVVMLSARQYAKQVAGRDVETPDGTLPSVQFRVTYLPEIVDTIIKSEPCNADAESKLIEQQELRDRMNNAQFRHQNLINHIMSTQIAYSRHAQLLATRLKTLTEEQKVLKTDLSSLENSMASSKSLVAHLEKEKECAAGKK
jgi:hypothetical protein